MSKSGKVLSTSCEVEAEAASEALFETISALFKAEVEVFARCVLNSGRERTMEECHKVARRTPTLALQRVGSRNLKGRIAVVMGQMPGGRAPQGALSSSWR